MFTVLMESLLYLGVVNQQLIVLRKAKKFMHQVGMDHIKDGLNAEGAALIYEANWGDGCQTKELFIKVRKDNRFRIKISLSR